MLKVKITEERIFIGERFSVSFQRTLRVPESARLSKLPPGFGPLPIRRVADYMGRTPKAWNADGAFLPLDEREAMWLSFNAASWKPTAVKVGVGGINAISGEVWDHALRDQPQDYLVCPPQLWLDGINAGENFIRQFIAVGLGQGYTVESQVTDGPDTGGIRIKAFDPKARIFPDQPPPKSPLSGVMYSPVPSPGASELGVGAGGKIEQRIYPDPYGVDVWDSGNSGEVLLYLTNHELYQKITGLKAPPSPVSAPAYTEHGLGLWFELADESLGDIAAPKKLADIKSARDLDSESGIDSPDENAEVELDENHLITLRHPWEEDIP